MCKKKKKIARLLLGNRQSLEQAITVCLDNKVKIKKIREWAVAEQQEKKFLHFEKELKKAKSQTKHNR